MRKLIKLSGIKSRAVIYISIPVIISFIIIYTILFVTLFNSHQDTVAANFQNIAQKHSANFENKFINAIDYLSFISSLLEFQVNENTMDRESLQKLIYNIFNNYPDINGSSIYFEPDVYDRNDSEYAGTQFGTSISGRISYYYRHFNGVTSYLPEAVGNDIEFSQPHYLNAKALNAPFYTDPTMFNIDGKDMFMVLIVFPLHDRNNEFIGAVTADIHLDDFYKELRDEKIYESGYIVITNDMNIIIYSPKFEDIGKNREEAGLIRVVPSQGTSIKFNEENEPEIIILKSAFNNKKSLLYRKTIQFNKLNSHVYFTVAAPLSEINADELRLVYSTIAVSIIIFIIIITIIYFIINKLAKPLAEFTEGSNRITEGDYSVRIYGNYKDEFAILKNSVNKMAEHIEEQMAESKRTLNILKKILNGIDAYIYVSVPETGEVLFINEQMRKLFNIKGDDCIGQRCYKLFRNLDSMCENCKCYKLEKNPDETIIWEEYDTTVNREIRHTDRFIDWPGGIKAHLQYSIDITDIKKITAEKTKAETEALNLASEKIHAEEISRTKSVFLASMSHEIRTPMHGIIGFSELALDSTIPVKTRNYLNKIKASAESLLMIINDILDISKIEAGKMDLEKIPFDISEVFKLCRIIASPKAFEKGLTLFCYAEPSIGRMLLGDPTRLRQILLNLLSNAIKFTNNGMVKLMSAITEKTENSITIHFEIKDSGIGMTGEQIEKIFHPFTQADGSTTRKYGGTGLGLTIAKSFIELMGGNLDVESNFGLGSKFSFNIKFDTIDKNTNLLDVSKLMTIDEKPIFNGEILVCEDNSMNQMVIADHLSRVGLKTIIAQNGKIGVNYVKTRIDGNLKQFDLIFMDIHMPEMDGLEAAKQILAAGCKTPIVALTANIMTTDRETYFKSGMCDCLPKPFVAYDLWACLLKYLKPVSTMTIKQDFEQAEDEDQRMELIIAFVKGNQSTIKDIKAAIEAQDLKLAHRLAHTLKSVAGIVGMTELAEAAQTVEKMLSVNNTKSLNKKINTLEKELNSALDELIPMIGVRTEKNKTTYEDFDKVKSLEILDTLDSLLESDSFDSLDLVKNLSIVPESEQLASEVENMKFKQARVTLAVIRQKILDMQSTEKKHE